MSLFAKRAPKKEDDKNQSGITATAYSDLVRSKKTYHIVIGSLSIAVMILTALVSAKSTEIIVMPPDYYEPVVVNGGYASQSYSAGHAMGIALLMGNISPKNVDFVTDTVMRKLSPQLQVKLGTAIKTEAKLIERRRARQVFEIEDVMFRNHDSLVWVWGTKETTIASNTMREAFTYEFRIQPNHGEPKVTHFDAYPGRPRIRSKEPVEVTPYLTRELALVKTYHAGEISIATPPTETTVEEESAPEGPIEPDTGAQPAETGA